MEIQLQNIRRDFTVGSLSRSEMPTEPITKVEEWLSEAIQLGVIEPTAILLATADAHGRPSARTLLLKEVHEGQFIFYTNYEGRKGKHIAENPHVSVTFLWHQLERQIHIEGVCRRVAPEVSDAYFAQRPYKSRVGARVSPQSQPIPSRSFIISEFLKESLKYAGRPVPRPDHWGGYAVEPTRIEFWQGRESRLHDRFLYQKQADGSWSLERLAP